MKLHRIALMLVAAFAVVFISSCNSDDDPTPMPTLYTDIVTVQEVAEGKTVFTLREKGDSPLITLTSSQTVNKEAFKIGTRVVITYSPSTGIHYVSDQITIYAAGGVIGEGKQVEQSTKEKTASWRTAPVSMYSATRTGEYINVVFTAFTGIETNVCAIVVDEETLEDEYPNLHLLFEPSSSSSQNNYAIYMSYSLADIFARPNCKGVKLFFVDSTNPRLSPVELDRPISNGFDTPDED